MKLDNKKICGCNEPCFERGIHWGHFEEVMCLHMTEKEIYGEICSVCAKDNEPICAYYNKKEYDEIQRELESRKLIDSFIDAIDVINTVRLEPILEYNGKKDTLIVTDRTRDVVYNGAELYMNNYKCSNCKTYYTFEQKTHKFCPFCGTEYKNFIDVSI